MDKNVKKLCGLNEDDIIDFQNSRLHVEVADSFQELQRSAAVEGFDLQIASGYRSFEQQLSIWNRKCTGELPVLDRNSYPLDISTMSPGELVYAILRWSALPGASRHHWGSEVDIYDAAAVAADYEVQLVPEEYEGEGPFAPLKEWLQQQPAVMTGEWFFPYEVDGGGVAPEPWHMSWTQVSHSMMEQHNPNILRELLLATEITHKDVILAELPDIWQRFVAV